MSNNSKQEKKQTVEIKQSFLASAITDISAYIQLADTKVSIIMAAVVAMLVGIAACYEPIWKIISKIAPCSLTGVLFIIFALIGVVGVALVFLFGILTISSHSCDIDYESKWFLKKNRQKYSFKQFSKDVSKMTDEDIIKNMAAELYKLNDINRRKMNTNKWTLCSFSLTLVSIAAIATLFLLNAI